MYGNKCDVYNDNYKYHKTGENNNNYRYFMSNPHIILDNSYSVNIPFSYFRIGIIPNNFDRSVCEFNCYGGKMIRIKIPRIIFSDKYYINNIVTITKFNLKITSNYIKHLSMYGRIDILEWLKNSNLLINYDADALDMASSKIGDCTYVLDWWKYSGLELKYSIFSLYYPSLNGHINILEWWKNSGLELKYSQNALMAASQCNRLNVFDWWKNSGLELKYSVNLLYYASQDGLIDVLKWWFNSGLPLKYDESVFIIARENGHHNIIQFLKESGLFQCNESTSTSISTFGYRRQLYENEHIN
jgi:hypothetical protein